MKNILKTILVTVGLFIASTALATPYQCYQDDYGGADCTSLPGYIMLGLNCAPTTAPGDPNASSVTSWDAYCDGLTHGSGVNCLSTAYNAAYNAAVCRCDTGWTGSACDSCASGYILIGGSCVYFSSHSLIYDNDVTGSSATPDTAVLTVNPATGADYDKITFNASGSTIGLLDPAGDTFTLTASTNDGSTNIIDGQDSDGTSQFYVDTDGEINGYRLATTPTQTGGSFGPETLSDTSIEAWTDPATPTTWGTFVFGVGTATVAQEAGTVHTGTYSAAITSGAGAGGTYIYQCTTGQTPGDNFGLGFWANGTLGDKVSVLIANADFGAGPTEMWDATTSAWIPWAALPDVEEKTLAATGWNNEGLFFTVPASGTMCYALIAEDSKTFYLDDVTAVEVIAATPMVLFDFRNPTDESKLGATDDIFDITTQGGTPKHWLTMTGLGVIETDLTALDFGNEKLTTTGNVEVKGTGDLIADDDSILNHVEVVLLTNEITGSSFDYIIHLFDTTARTTGEVYMLAGSNATPVGTAGMALQTNTLVTVGDNSTAYEGRIDTQGVAAGVLTSAYKSYLYDHASDAAGSVVAGYVSNFALPTAGLGSAVGFLSDNRTNQLDYDLMSLGDDLRIKADMEYGATSAGADVYIEAGDGKIEGKGGDIEFKAGDAVTAIAANLNGGGFTFNAGDPTGTGSTGSTSWVTGAGGTANTFLEIAKFGPVLSSAIMSNEATSGSTIGLVLGNRNNLSAAGDKLVSFRDDIVNGTGGTELLYIDYIGDIYAPAELAGGTALKIEVVDQGATTIAGNDMVFEAGDGGTDTTGGAGGSFIFNVGEAQGTGDNNGGKFSIDLESGTGSGSAGWFELAFNGTWFLKSTTDDKRDVYFLSNAIDDANSVAFFMGAQNNLPTAGTKLLSIGDDVVGTYDEALSLLVDGEMTFGPSTAPWGKIYTAGGSANAMNFMSYASGSVQAFTFNTDAAVDDTGGLVLFANNDTLKAGVYGNGNIFAPEFEGILRGVSDSAKVVGDELDAAASVALEVGNEVELTNASAKLLRLWTGAIGTTDSVFAVMEDGAVLSGLTAVNYGYTDMPSVDTIFNATNERPTWTTKAGVVGVGDADTVESHGFVGIAYSTNDYEGFGMLGQGKVKTAYTPKNTTGVYGVVTDTHDTDYVTSITFTGTGDDDMSKNSAAWTGISYLRYCIIIDAEGTPDTFKWSNTGCTGSFTSGVAITGAAQALDEGITITFTGTDNHTLDDKWEFTAYPGGSNIAVRGNASGGVSNFSFSGDAGWLYNADAILGSSDANTTDFSDAAAIMSNGNTNITSVEAIGLVGESVATTEPGIGVLGIGETSSTDPSIGVKGIADVGNIMTDTSNAIGVMGESIKQHDAGLNIGVWAVANNVGTVTDRDYAIYVEDGKTKLLGGFLRNTRAVTDASESTTQEDDILHVTYTATGAVAIELETDTCNGLLDYGRQITIKDAGGLAGTNNITVSTEGSELIDGAATYVINSNYASIDLYCYNGNWFIH